MTSTLPNDNIRKFDDQITNKLISEIIRDRIKNSGTRFSANDNISDFINPGELEILEKEVASRVEDLLKSLVIDVENDHNTQETAERVSKMYLNEVFKGRYHEQPKVTSFPNDKNLDEIYTDLYRISEAEDWMNKAQKIIFIGTSFSVNITSIALRSAISRGIKIDIVDPNPIKINYDKVNYHQMNAEEYCNFRNLN